MTLISPSVLRQYSIPVNKVCAPPPRSHTPSSHTPHSHTRSHRRRDSSSSPFPMATMLASTMASTVLRPPTSPHPDGWSLDAGLLTVFAARTMLGSTWTCSLTRLLQLAFSAGQRERSFPRSSTLTSQCKLAVYLPATLRSLAPCLVWSLPHRHGKRGPSSSKLEPLVETVVKRPRMADPKEVTPCVCLLSSFLDSPHAPSLGLDAAVHGAVARSTTGHRSGVHLQ